MSAPQTNIEHQKRRHIAPLVGMALAVLFGVGLILWWVLGEVGKGRGPEAPPVETGAGATAPPADAAAPVTAPPAAVPIAPAAGTQP